MPIQVPQPPRLKFPFTGSCAIGVTELAFKKIAKYGSGSRLGGKRTCSFLKEGIVWLEDGAGLDAVVGTVVLHRP